MWEWVAMVKPYPWLRSQEYKNVLEREQYAKEELEDMRSEARP